MKISKDKIKILFVYYSLQSFVERDLEILQKHFCVNAIQWRGKRDILKIALGILKSELSFSWFAGDYAAVAVFFSKLFSKKSIVIAGGFDVAYVPEINYGQFTLKWYKRMLTKFALKNADIVLVVDPSLKKQIRYLLRKPCNHVKYLPTGYNPNYFKLIIRKKQVVLTVGAVNWKNIKRKGLEIFVRSAKHFPDVDFVLAGKHSDDSVEYLKKIASNNVVFTGFISDEELLEWYQKAKVYCQLSRHEGLPNSLCEAMLCECVPVGSFQNGIPRAIAHTGFYAPYGDEKATVEAIREALNETGELGRKARIRIKEMFSSEKREKNLVDIIQVLNRDKNE